MLLLALAACPAPKDPPAAPAGPPTGPLAVLAIGPRGEVTGPVQVFATFDKPVTRLGEMDDARAHEFLRVTPEKPGQYRFLGTQTVIFEFTGDAPRSSEFTAEVPLTARSVDGSGPAQTARSQFTTLRLAVTDTSPGKGYKQAPSRPAILLTFNQPVDPADVTRHTSFRLPAPHAPVTATCTPAPRDATPNSLTCTATADIAPSTAVDLVVAAALHGAEGALGMAAEFALPFAIHGPPGVERVLCDDGCKPEYGARISFLTPVIPKKAAQFLVVEPAIDMTRFSGDYPSTSLYLGQLKPSSAYQVTIRAGLVDEFGQATQGDQSFQFTTAAATPRATVPRGFLTMEPGAPVLRVHSTNAHRATLRAWKLSDAEAPVLARAFDRGGGDVKRRPHDAAKDIDLKYVPDQRTLTEIPLSEWLPGGRGLMAYSLVFKEVFSWRDHPLAVDGFIQGTSMGVSVKAWNNGVLVWVTGLADGKPVAGATVTVTDPTGLRLWNGTTDESGLAYAAGIDVAPAREAWAVVRHDDDVALGSAEFDDGLSVWDLGGQAAWGEDNQLVGLVFTDRGVYRPGEPVHVKVLARTLSGGELGIPRETSAKLEVMGPTGDNVLTRNVKLSALGTANLTFNLDKGSKLGSYNLHFGYGDDGQGLYASVLVEEFKAPDFKVEVLPARPQMIMGESVPVTARAAYLFGAPLSEAAVKYTVTLSPSYFQPPGAEGYTFNDDTRWLSDGYISAQQLASAEAKAGKDGTLSINVEAKGEPPGGPGSASVEVTATDPSGQAITGSTSITVHPGEHYLGLRTRESLLKSGEAFPVEVVALKPDGAPATGSATVVLKRREYRSMRQAGLGEATEPLQAFEDKEVARCEVSGLGKEPKACSLTPTAAGLFLLSVSGKDSKGRELFAARVVWVAGPGEAPWASDESLAVKLVPDRKSYKPGDVAKVLVQNPWPGARALVTLERGGVLSQKVVTLDGSAPVLEVPVEEKYVPNVWLGVVLVRGRTAAPQPGKPDRDKPAVRGGYALIPVDTGTRRLAVALSTDAPVYGPRDEVKATVKVADQAGAPAAAEVALFVVDESVLQLTGFRTPDPVPLLYAQRGISVRTGDSRVHVVDARSYGEKGEEEGGGGLGALLGDEAVRGRFLTCAYFNPAIKVPASGVAEVSFKLPDNLTSFRLMALAIGEGHRVGSAEGSLRVRKPLMLRAAQPRLLRVGDDAQVGVVIVNASDSAGPVDLAVENRTPELVKLGPAAASVQTAAGASVPFRVPVTALKSGTAVLRFAGKLGATGDGLELRFPVADPVPLLHDGTYGTVEGGKKVDVPLGLPAGARDDVGGLTVTLATTLLTQLSGSALFLATYPYDCAEQTASKLLPYVELASLRQVFDPAAATPEALQAKANAAVQKLLAFQNDDGGTGYWAGHTSNPWLTAWSTLALARAQAAGFKVPAQSLHRAQAYLKDMLAKWPAGVRDAWGDEALAFVVDVLATLKDPVPSFASTLFDRRAAMPLEARAMLLHAMALAGNARQVKPLADDLLAHVHQSAKGATVQSSSTDRRYWTSPTREHALVLRALVAAGADQAVLDKLAVGLVAAQQRGTYRTTQEASWAMLALRDYQDALQTAPMKAEVTASAGTTDVVKAAFDKVSFDTVVGTAPVAAVKAGTLSIGAEGSGTVHWGATVSHAPSAIPSVPVERGLFIQRVLKWNGQPVKDRVKAGQLLHLVVELSTPADRHDVVVDVPVPAGMELVNVRFSTSETVPPVAGGEPRGDEDCESEECAEAWRPDPTLQGPFDHVELRDDRLLLFASSLPRGVHRYVAGVRSVTPGTYRVPPAKAEGMYEPEVVGQTPGSTFTVEAP
ncbi:MAG: Ig-like domain-containing protein [Deltaproteobacteria bacterium]|nr:Ig-like domain-containing protein [Deltaproteobacteria bacterium]